MVDETLDDILTEEGDPEDTTSVLSKRFGSDRNTELPEDID